MTSNRTSAPAGTAPAVRPVAGVPGSPAAPAGDGGDVPPPSLAAGVDVLTELDGLLDTWHLVTVKVVEATVDAVRTGLCESLEGLPVDHWLRLRARMLGADAATLVTAADVLPSMPIAWDLFRSGEISWGTARNIAAKLARYPVDFRLRVDAQLGDTVQSWEGLDGWSADRLLGAVDRTIYELLDTSVTHKDEQADVRASYVAVQPSFDGRVRGGFDLDPVAGATVLDALAAATPDGPSTTLGRRRAAGLVDMAARYLAGGDGRKAKPLIRIVVQLADVTETAAGHVQLRTPGCLPRLSARLVELLATDADLQAVLCDGARPLATSRKRKATDIPADVRAAIVARDVADRMPGSDRPLQHIHHNRHRGDGGDHDPDNLTGLSLASHRRIHKHGWTSRHDPRTGVFSITRDGRTWTSVPPTTPLGRPHHGRRGCGCTCHRHPAPDRTT